MLPEEFFQLENLTRLATELLLKMLSVVGTRLDDLMPLAGLAPLHQLKCAGRPRRCRSRRDQLLRDAPVRARLGQRAGNNLVQGR